MAGASDSPKGAALEAELPPLPLFDTLRHRPAFWTRPLWVGRGADGRLTTVTLGDLLHEIEVLHERAELLAWLGSRPQWRDPSTWDHSGGASSLLLSLKVSREEHDRLFAESLKLTFRSDPPF